MKAKKWLSLMLAGLMTCSVVGFAACDSGDKTDNGQNNEQDGGNPTEEQVKITLDYDADKGSVTLDPAPVNGKIKKGTAVTLTVTAKENYTVDSLSLPEGAQSLGGGKYSFTADKDITISVTFAEGAQTPDAEAPAFSDQQATLSLTGKINKTNARRSVSGDLFGLFLEDINYASQALDDNLIANGNFESTVNVSNFGHDHAWTAGGGLSLSVVTGEKKLHVNSPYYAQINTPAGGTLSNQGFSAVPMYLQRNKQYLFSAFLRGYTGEITVRAKDSANQIYAEKTFSVQAGEDEWLKTEQTLTATETGESDISLEISFAAADNDVLLDAVQFETLDATAGFKNYMYKAISNLSPAFFRFPGGCVIEGTSAVNAYDWKNSIGAVKDGDDDILPAFSYQLDKDGTLSDEVTYGEWATRIPNGNIWQQSGKYYPHEYGIGFYEYFLLCDSLGAKAIPIVNCGLSCQTQTKRDQAGYAVALQGRHNKGVADYIQDAIDLIEFAKGDTTTEWGHIRELMGHPEPFEMDYIGIGNEQWGDYYQQYYEQFLKDANFRKALADYNVKPIVGNCTMFSHCEDPDLNRQGVAQRAANAAVINGVVDSVADYGVVDQHYYVNYTDFLANTDLYDNYKRPSDEGYYEVFVGEYAVNSYAVRSPEANDNIEYRHTNNSMITALSEAAMMTGFERNGDVVKLAAYAPMFAPTKSANRQWGVDMMYFTNNSVLLTPNYYVQQLFMQNTGDYKVNAKIAYTEGVTAPKTVYMATLGSQTRELDDIFYVASCDEETGDVILKIVNAGKTTLKVNVDFGVTDLALTGIADVVELYAKNADDCNTEDSPRLIRPRTSTIGIDGTVFGYSVKPYSVTAFRIHIK